HAHRSKSASGSLSLLPEGECAGPCISTCVRQSERDLGAARAVRRVDGLGGEGCAAQSGLSDGALNLANQLRECNRVAQAVVHYRRALELKPDYLKAKWNLGISNLLLGSFRAGWPAYELRDVTDHVSFDKFTQPRWDGCSLAGKTIVVHAEQGIGD